MKFSFYIQAAVTCLLFLFSFQNVSAQFEGGDGSGYDTLSLLNLGCNSYSGNSNSGYTAEHNPSGGNCSMFAGDSSSGHFSTTPAESVCHLFIGGDNSGHNHVHYVNPYSCVQFTESAAGGSGYSSRSFSNGLDTCTIVALAIEASPLFGTVVNNEGYLYWETYSERGNMGFELQKTYDGQVWEVIGWVDGAEYSSSTIQYGLYDQNLSGNGQYYRYKQIDFDGTFSYSNIVYLNVDTPESMEEIFVLYPNPSHSFNGIKLKGWVQKEWNVQLTVADLTGRILFSERHIFDKGMEVFEFPHNFFTPGTYYLFLQTEDGSSSLQIPFVIIN